MLEHRREALDEGSEQHGSGSQGRVRGLCLEAPDQGDGTVEGYNRLTRAGRTPHPGGTLIAALHRGPLIGVQEDHPVFDRPGQQLRHLVGGEQWRDASGPALLGDRPAEAVGGDGFGIKGRAAPLLGGLAQQVDRQDQCFLVAVQVKKVVLDAAATEAGENAGQSRFGQVSVAPVVEEARAIGLGWREPDGRRVLGAASEVAVVGRSRTTTRPVPWLNTRSILLANSYILSW